MPSDQTFFPPLLAAPLFVWLAIFVPQPHKEERFLFPVYPLVALAAAATLVALARAAIACKLVGAI